MRKKCIRSLWFWLGMAVMTVTMIPNLILGEGSIFTYHDQLDGEVIAYILQARNLFSGDSLPEFMGGMPKTALVPPAPLCVLLYIGGNGFAALTIMQLAGRIVGFGGMYLLAGKVTKKYWVGAVAGVLYGLLPFLPVYGLSQYGIPMLFWAALQLREKRHKRVAFGYVVFFGLTSSLVLVGFGLLGMGMVVMLWDWKRRKGSSFFALAWLSLCGVYVAENFRLLSEVLGWGERELSHKAEYHLDVRPFWETFWEVLFQGGQHSNGYQKYVAPVVLAAAAVSCLLMQWRASCSNDCRTGACGEDGWEGKRILRILGGCVAWNCFFAVMSAFWGSGGGIWVRKTLGTLGAFQLDRVLWITPALWYLAVACGGAVLWDFWTNLKGGRKIIAAGCLCVSALAVGITGVWILYAGDVKSNIQKLRNPEYGFMSFEDYYALGVMEQVRDFLTECTGEGQEAYRVVSLGIDPAAALYHGFYCLDGYSNHYPLSYKHRFREIISPELAKSEYLTKYFDNWGNRCYLFSAECPGYYTIEKNGFYFREYHVNGEALSRMGCRYLLSAAYIENALSQGLVLMREAPFETEDSYYRIYVYEVAQ